MLMQPKVFWEKVYKQIAGSRSASCNSSSCDKICCFALKSSVLFVTDRCILASKVTKKIQNAVRIEYLVNIITKNLWKNLWKMLITVVEMLEKRRKSRKRLVRKREKIEHFEGKINIICCKS